APANNVGVLQVARPTAADLEIPAAHALGILGSPAQLDDVASTVFGHESSSGEPADHRNDVDDDQPEVLEEQRTVTIGVGVGGPDGRRQDEDGEREAGGRREERLNTDSGERA